VFDVIAAAGKVTGREIPTRMGPRREGDPAVLVASSEKIKKELGWRPKHEDLYAIIESAWSWMRDHELAAK
jgi:UDP-glucose 4-epimerase